MASLLSLIYKGFYRSEENSGTYPRLLWSSLWITTGELSATHVPTGLGASVCFLPCAAAVICCHAHAFGISNLSCVQASLGGQGVVGKQVFEKTEAGHDESPSVLW